MSRVAADNGSRFCHMLGGRLDQGVMYTPLEIIMRSLRYLGDRPSCGSFTLTVGSKRGRGARWSYTP